MKWIELPPVSESIRSLRELWGRGWHERNSGNLSVRIEESNLEGLSNLNYRSRWIDLGLNLPSLGGDVFLVSGTGQHFRQAEAFPERVLGLIKINAEGSAYQILAGLSGGGPTSELPTHLLNHAVRKGVGDRVVLHSHPTSLLALSAVLPLDEAAWSYALWNACTESIVVFPEGLGILPWMLCGSIAIGEATAEKMKTFRLVLWAHHGVFAMGKDIEETFGLIETAEKSAEVYGEILKLGGFKQEIGSKNLRILAETFKAPYNEGFLK